MVVVAGLAGLFSVLTSWIVGARLVLLARRTHRLPELWIGLALFLTGGVWSPLVAVGRQATVLSDPLRGALVCIGSAAGLVGMGSLAIFTWRTYRPADGWAGRLAAAIGLALAAPYAAQTVEPGWLEFAHAERGPWLIGLWVGIGIYCWANVEAWRQYGMQRRRTALGLADPVVTDRMRLWALSLVAALAGALTLAVCQRLGIPVAGTAIGLALTAVIACVAGGCLWLAFLPPPGYLARVRRAAAAAA